MSNTIKKDIKSLLKFVYSENNSISVIFHENDLLLGVVGEFNRNLKELELKTHFGKVGTHFYRVVRSLQDNPVNPNRIRKSIGAEQTFNQDIETESFMLDKLAGIAEELEKRMAKSSNKGKTITIKIKYSDFSQQTRSKTVENYVSTKEEFFPIIKDLLFQKSLEKPVRLLGISITKLFNEVNIKEDQVSLQLKFDFNQFG